MDDTHRTQRILSGRFMAGAALPYTDEHGIVWSLDFSDVKGITRRMVQAEARATADLARLRALEAELNDIASRLAVEDARTTLQAKTIRGLEAVIREYLDALDVACNHVMRTDDDFASYEPIDARLEAAEEAMKAAITPPPASTGEEPTR